MVTVAVVGASGGVGRAVVHQALNAGASVRALARTRSKAEAALGGETLDRLEKFIEGDVGHPAALAELLSGSGVDVVISCLGTPQGATPCVEAGTRSVVAAMHSSGCMQLVVVSSIGVGDSLAQGQNMAPFFIRCIVPLFLGKVFRDLEDMEEFCWSQPGGVKCVAVRPPQLTDDKPEKGIEPFIFTPASNLRPTTKKPKISRQSVAAAMVQLATKPGAFNEWAGKGVTVVVP